ncbi:MAG: TRAP transporter substrate-binding protein [Gammaproteobacteria bacterium]|nr:TRAP transporter substrate-binding protein [Gammaproteobacteria bacterium]
MSPIKITMAGYQPPASVHNRAAEVFGRELLAQTGDAVTFEFDGNLVRSKGCRAVDLPVMTERGELSLCYFASSYLTEQVPELAIFDVPFVVRDRNQAYAALDGALGELLADRFLANTGLRVLAFWDNGFRHFSNGVHSLRTPADCQGLSIRSMNSALHQEFFRQLGFEPTFVDVRDLVEAARSGRIDAQENPLTNTYNFGTHRYHRYITLSAHLFGVVVLLCHNASYQAWPETLRVAVRKAAEQATQVQRQLAAAEDEEVLAQLDPAENEVAHLTDAERAGFLAAVAPMLAKQREVLGSALFELVE